MVAIKHHGKPPSNLVSVVSDCSVASEPEPQNIKKEKFQA